MSSTITDQLKLADIESFKKHIRYSDRVLALCGAGLSAASGLPTFRGAGGLWRSHDAVRLATPEAFGQNPGLVWQFYSYRRHMALGVKPNPAHFALAQLAKRKKGFQTLTQNVDGLSQRAGHPLSQLHLLHGSLFDLRCTSFYCNYVERNNFVDPIVPALAIPKASRPTAPLGISSNEANTADPPAFPASEASEELDISDDRVELPHLHRENLPQCPQCDRGLLRPGVVWFGEMLPEKTIQAVDKFIDESQKIDLILVIGTSARVYPAAGYVQRAKEKGAKIAVINMDRADIPGGRHGLEDGDWFFEGDAATILPELLKDEVGDVSRQVEKPSS
ncbi:hypothetical protein ACLMJK_007797 [Lecanora helva]